MSVLTIKYPMFDGSSVWEGAAVTVEDGVITAVAACSPAECGDGFLLPGMVDAHTHMGTTAHVEALLRHGITATFDVSAPAELMAESRELNIISSVRMAGGVVLNPKGFVEKAAAAGAKYIKVLLFHPLSIGMPALRGIVKAARQRGLKVAAHATEVTTVRQAVEAGVDVLLHTPLAETLPTELAETIAKKGIAVAPTLVMMDAFAHSGKFGFKESDYTHAEQAVGLLYRCGVKILAATDANPGSYTPGVEYGVQFHRELQLLAKAGLPAEAVLHAATAAASEAFCMDGIGKIAPGQPATMVLVSGRPEKNIEDTTKIAKIWISGNEYK